MAGLASKCFSSFLVNFTRSTTPVCLSSVSENRLTLRRQLANDASTSSASFDSIGHGDSSAEEEAVVEYEFGLPVITLTLPSRRERCQFTLKPVTQTVGDLCSFVRAEDHGAEIVAVYKRDGKRMSSFTPLEHLLQLDKFRIRINDTVYAARPPSLRGDSSLTELTTEHVRCLDDVRATVASLHASLNIDQHQLNLEAQLIAKLEDYRQQLRPLQRRKAAIERETERRTSRSLYAGLAAMGVQLGAFGRLTWWEYSWDIMEPVTYFATLVTAIAAAAYFVVTRQVYEYDQAHSRVRLLHFYRRSAAHQPRFDVAAYNRLTTLAARVQDDLDRLRDPLYQHLPATRLATLLAQQGGVGGDVYVDIARQRAEDERRRKGGDVGEPGKEQDDSRPVWPTWQ